MQSVVITFSNIIVQYYINGLGAVSVAAFAVYYKLENFIYLPIVSFGQAATTFAAQNLGAGKKERISKGAWLNLVMGVVITVIIAGIILMFPYPIFRLFMKDPDVVEHAIIIGKVSCGFYWIYVFIEVFGGSIRGMGRSVTSMVTILSTLCGARILLLVLFAHTDYTLKRIATVYPITWALAGAGFLGIFLVLMRKPED